MASDIPVYQTAEEMDEALQSYFPWCEENDRVPNIIGLVLHIGFSSRTSLVDYSKKSERFEHVIKKAKARCYDMKFDAAIKGKLNPTIFIFDAVNNHDMFNTRSENKNQDSGQHEIVIRREIIGSDNTPTKQLHQAIKKFVPSSSEVGE